VKEFPVTYEEAVRRDRVRADSVGHEVIFRQYMQWHEYIGSYKYVAKPDTPKCILVDIDGTVATMGERGPFEWDKVDLDTRREEIADMVRGYALQDYAVIMVSGRDSICREKTVKWLAKNGIRYDQLLMRPIGDQRKDCIVKEELFMAHIADQYDVRAVLDDRNQVVINTWIKLGLTVVHVGNPWNSF
jgi:hypothetical protein